jgi:hypothetical protein
MAIMTKLATMTWPSLADRQLPGITAARTTYIDAEVAADNTTGGFVDVSDTVTTRPWLDQTSADNWATFITTTATNNGTTVNVVISNIS